MAAPSVRAAGLATSGTTTTSVTINKPSGTASGDVLYAVVVNGSATSAPSSVPSGWTLVESKSTGIGWSGVYRLVAGGSEPSTYAWSGFTDSCTGCMVAIQGADTSTPEDVTNSQANTNSNGACGSITTTGADRLIVALCGLLDNQVLNVWTCATDPASLTENAEQLSSGGNDTGSGIASAAKTTAGATGAMAVTLGGSRDNVGFLIAVRPPAGGQSAAVGTATETDSAIALGRMKTRAATTATESDAAIALGRVKTRALGVATETDSGIALGRVKSRTVGVASSTDTALALGRVKTKTIGIAVETDTARPVTTGGPHVIPVSVAVESDSARPIGRAKTRTVGVAAQTSTAGALGRAKARLAATTVETDTAMPVTRPPTGPAPGVLTVADQPTGTHTPADQSANLTAGDQPAGSLTLSTSGG